MGFFSRIFGGKKAASGSTATQTHGKHDKEELLSTANDVECPHIDLGAHWANAADIGQMDKVDGFKCGGCGRIFTPAEAEALRETEASRLAWMQEGEQATTPQSSGPSPNA